MIDDTDHKLIQELQRDGKQSYVDLAKKLGTVEGTVRRRINELMCKNVIKIIALPNLRKLGYNMISIMGLQVKMGNLKNVSEGLSKNPNVCYLAFVTGRYDLIAILITRSPEDLSNFIENEISQFPSILRTETFVNLNIIKGGWPELDTKSLINPLETFHSKPRKYRK